MTYTPRVLLFQRIPIIVFLGCFMATMSGVKGTGLSRHKRATGSLIPIPAEERDAGLLRHNTYRAMQNASNMEYMAWNSELARMAEEYIGQCVFEHSDMMNTNKKYNFSYVRVGENLHYNTKEVSLAEAVDAWYEEINYYTYETNSCETGNVCGHYTQVVWARSELVGCAKVRCPVLDVPYKNKKVNNAVYTGCNYGGPGNMAGVKPFMLGSPCSACHPKDYPAGGHGCKMGMCYIENGVDGNGKTNRNETGTGHTGTYNDQTGTNTGQEGTKTEQKDTTAGETDTNPSQERTNTSQEGTKTEQKDTTAGETDTNPSQERTNTSQEGTKTEQKDTTAGETDTNPSQERTNTSQEGTKTEQKDTTAGETDTNPSQERTNTGQKGTTTGEMGRSNDGTGANGKDTDTKGNGNAASCLKISHGYSVFLLIVWNTLFCH